MAFQGDSIYWVEVAKVVANPFQPRREFDEAKLKELADSIRMYGVLQPLTVTRKEIQREDGTFYTEYELIAGERRLRASKLAGVAQVPVIIREGEQSEQEKLELAIIENLQREDLNAVDRALAFRQLADSFGLSHSQVAEKVGRSREYVSNTIRLLALPEYILDALRQGDISEGHARTLLMLSDKPEEQQVIFKEITLKKLSVRESERIIRKLAADRVRKKNPDEFDTELLEYEKQFTETLGTRVQIQKTEFGGKLTIDYFSVEDLETILERMRDAEAPAAAQASVHEAINALREHTPLESRDTSAATAATLHSVATQAADNTTDPAPQSAPDHDKQPVPASQADDSPTPPPPSHTEDRTEAGAPQASPTSAVGAPAPEQAIGVASLDQSQASVSDVSDASTAQSAVSDETAAPSAAVSATTPMVESASPTHTSTPPTEPSEKRPEQANVPTPPSSTPAPAGDAHTPSSTEATATTNPSDTPPTPAEPGSSQPDSSTETNSTNESQETPASTTQRKDEDDAGLYSIRNFSI